jgi:hypothetical protein
MADHRHQKQGPSTNESPTPLSPNSELGVRDPLVPSGKLSHNPLRTHRHNLTVYTSYSALQKTRDTRPSPFAPDHSFHDRWRHHWRICTGHTASVSILCAFTVSLSVSRCLVLRLQLRFTHMICTMFTPLAIAIGLIVMMWPILTKVQYETLPQLFSTSRIWTQIGISMFLNWIVGPLIMLALAWATLPDLPTYRTGVIMVGLARCIAMVMIWNELAKGNPDYCAILVVINSILQIILYSPYALLFINTVGGNHRADIHVSYGNVAISVLIVSPHSHGPLLLSVTYLISFPTSISAFHCWLVL